MKRRALLTLLVALSALLPLAAVAASPRPGFVRSSCSRSDGGYRCSVGPFDVRAGETVEIVTGVAAPSEAGYITSAQASLVDAHRKPVPHHQVHLHHAVWLNPYRDDMTCDSYDDGRFPGYDRFFATGKEFTKAALPAGYGYYWNPGVGQPYTQSAPWWTLVVHLDGMHGSSEVYIETDVGFVAQDEAKDVVDVRPVWLDVRNCSSDPVYTVAKGSGTNGLHKERWTYEMPQAGRFVFIAGHLHDGGLRISLENLTTGEHIYTSNASYGLDDEPWYLTEMSSWRGAPGIKVSKGDKLRLTAVYDSSRRREDVMGIMGGVLAPAR